MPKSPLRELDVAVLVEAAEIETADLAILRFEGVGNYDKAL